MSIRVNRAMELRDKISSGKVVIGGHTFYNDPAITEALACHGFEFVWIDGEHSTFDKQCTLTHIMAAASGGAASIFRVPWNDPVLVKPILEMGPDGIIFPMVCTKADAEIAIRSTLYPPKGIRGFGPRRANGYGMQDTREYLDESEDTLFRIVQIEHIDAVNNLEDILSVDGIDLPLVGPNDLSASIGHLGDTRHPDVIKLYEKIIETCKRMGKPFGVSLGAGDHVGISYWIEKGASFVGCGDDISYISMGSKATLDFVSGLLK